MGAVPGVLSLNADDTESLELPGLSIRAAARTLVASKDVIDPREDSGDSNASAPARIHTGNPSVPPKRRNWVK